MDNAEERTVLESQCRALAARLRQRVDAFDGLSGADKCIRAVEEVKDLLEQYEFKFAQRSD